MQIELLRIGVAADIQRHQANEPGSVPAGWVRWAETVLPSRIDWRRVLAAEVRRAVAAIAGNVDYTYQRPSRRAHLQPDVVKGSVVVTLAIFFVLSFCARGLEMRIPS